MIKLNPKDIRFLIIHHTGTSRDRTTFEAIKRNHIVKGFLDVGYHYLITADGILHKGRDEGFVGVHARALSNGISMNRQSLGICLTGNFEVETPTDNQIATLEGILNDKRAEYGVVRTNVLGHFEIPHATACPGRNLMPFIRTYRAGQSQSKDRQKLINSIKQKIESLKKRILEIKGRKSI